MTARFQDRRGRVSLRRRREGFSLIEITVAFGIVVFVVLSLSALLPMGLESNKTSAEETRAAGILTAAEADLRNSINTDGKSSLFGLEAPYTLSGGNAAFNTPTTDTVYATGLTDSEAPVAVSRGVRYQLSVVYTKVPSGTQEPMQARLIVNWPCLAANASVTALTSLAGANHFLEAYVAFPAP